MNTKHISLLVGMSLLWAGTFICVKVADATLDPYTIMASRALIGTVFLFALLPLTGISLLPHFRNVKYQLICFGSSVLIAYMWLTIAFSEETISAGMSSLLLTALAVFSWTIATFITREKSYHLFNLFGIVLSTFGIAVMIGLQHIVQVDHNLGAELFYISGLLFFAAAAALNKKWIGNVNPMVTLAFNFLHMSIILGVLSLLFGTPFGHQYNVQNVMALIGLGLVSTGVGYMIFFYLVKHAGLLFASYNSYLVPTFGMLLGNVLLHENIHAHQLLGLTIMFAGMFLIQKKFGQTAIAVAYKK